MKNKIAVLFFLSVFFAPFAVNAGPLCAFTGSNFNQNADQQPSPTANQHMGQVDYVLCGRFKCPGYVLLSNYQAGNAQAWMDSHGALIRVNPSFMNGEVSKYGELATIGILAHELGHLIDFSSRHGNIPQHDREAKADEYAGCAFALAGNPKSDLTPLARSLSAMGNSPGYPTGKQRVQLISAGYDRCRQ